MNPPNDPRALARVAFAAAALSARVMHLGNTLVASRNFTAAGLVTQTTAAELRTCASECLAKLGLSAREAEAALRLLALPANDLHPQEFLREAEALTTAVRDLCDDVPGDSLVVWQSMVSLREVYLHLREVVRESTPDARRE